MFYSVALQRTIAWDTASQTTLRNCSKEVREEPAYLGVFAEKKNMQSNIKILLLITHTHRTPDI